MLTQLSTTQLSAANYYWVGGAGNWAVLDHWATTSGGAVRHSQIPTAADDVIFDANSFSAGNQVVNVNVPTAFCRSFTWTGVTNTPILRGSATCHLVVYGSLTLVPSMQFDFLGDVTFQGATTGNTITMAGKKFFKNLNFDNATGEWTCQSPIVVDSTVTLKNGTLKTNSQALDANRLYANCETSGTLDLANSSVILRGGFFQGHSSVTYTLLLEPLHTKTVLGGSHTIDCTSATAYVWIGEATYRLTNVNPVYINALHFSNTSGCGNLLSYYLGTPNFNSIKFSSNGKLLNSDMNIRRLTLARGKSTEFESGKLFKIDALDADGTCVSAILMKSTNTGEIAKLSSINAITADYVTIQDLITTGRFTATNAIKLGTTTGWTVVERTPQRLYWVNGNGNWDDINHWSTSSGGASGACVPTAKDDVVFDQYSFSAAYQKAIINVEDAFCKNMTWDNTRENAGIGGLRAQNLHIFGSFYLSPTMIWAFEGRLLFESEAAGQEVKMAGKEMLNHITFNGDGGWIQQDNLQTQLGIYFLKGTWNTNSHTVSCMFFRSETKLNRKWIMGNSDINVATIAPIYTGMILFADSLSVDAGRSHLRMLKDFSKIYIFGSGNLKFYNLTFFNTYETLSNEREEVKLSFNKVEFTSTHSVTRGSVTIDTLIVAAGSDNIFDEGFKNDANGETITTDTKITVKTVITPIGCEVAKTVLRKANLRKNVTFVANRPSVVLTGCIIKNILAEGNMIVNDGRGLGVTTGWTINRGRGRQLYWVGNGGQWFDKRHWSLASGGTGGECIPTDEDDVFFDARSFSDSNQLVGLSRGPNGLLTDYVQACRNMDWTGARLSPKFHFMNLYVFGNIKFLPTPQMTTEAEYLTLLSDNSYTVQTEDHKIHSVDMAGKGIGTFQSQMVADYFAVSGGGLTTNSHDLTVSFTIDFNNFTQDSVYMRLQNSLIRLVSTVRPSRYHDNVNFNGDKISFDAGRSTFKIETDAGGINSFNPSTLTQKYRFHNVVFTSPTGMGRTFSVNTNFFFNKLFFAGDGELWNVNEMDSLIFSAGKTYSISATNLQTVYKYFEMIGNNCLSIRLQSLTSGVKATVRMNSGVIASDFVQMSDQKTDGTIQFFAGAHSTNIGTTNNGWRFESPFNLKEIGFLGRDTVFCNATALELKALTSNIATYKWSTNATTSSIYVTTPGEYRAEVTYTNNCVIRDTILIEQVNLAPFALGADTLLCQNEKVTLQMPFVPNATYSWQDGKTTPQYSASKAGVYKGEITVKGCKVSDEVAVEFVEVGALNLGQDTTLCEGQALALNVTLGGVTYLWQDGNRTPQYSITQAGLYWVEIGSNNCKIRDSIRVNFGNTVNFDIGPDKTLCEGETTMLKASVPNARFQWQDGSTSETFEVSQAGVYTVVASIGTCRAADTVIVGYKPSPNINLGNDTTLCEGNTLLLKAEAEAGATYRWDNNMTSSYCLVQSKGKYKVTVSLNGCTQTDSINIGFNPIPTLNLGNDTTVCGAITYLLKSRSNATTFKWQDGSTQANYRATQSGQYAVEATLNGCSKMDTVQVAIKEVPTFELGNDTLVCGGKAVTLKANLQRGTLKWSNNSTANSIVVTKSNRYTAEANYSGCIFRDTIKITFSTPPQYSLGADTSICRYDTVTLRINVPNTNISWYNQSKKNIETITEEGTYWADVVSKEGCTHRDSIKIIVDNCIPFRPYVPNVFSPNNDGANDDVKPFFQNEFQITDNYLFQIYDRWGGLVFSTNDKNAAWNGTHRNQEIDNGVFVYMVKLTYKDFKGTEKKAVLSGDITLLR
ncbi:MAG: gliding motility-associated C-terminal domain-containing protein [Saprospiraceae bacterium]|nr:gliding motility-associated C-terminal domain-containing protein [Saprospiraceae bacterium]